MPFKDTKRGTTQYCKRCALESLKLPKHNCGKKETKTSWIKEVKYLCPKCKSKKTEFNLKNNRHYCPKCDHLIAHVPYKK